MPMEDLLAKKHRVIVLKIQTLAAEKLQKWWRAYKERKHRKIAPMGLWEIKRMIDRLVYLQNWWRSIV